MAVNPADPTLLMTAGNDYTARVLDIRGLGGKRGAGDALAAPELAIMTHSKVINSAYFSPVTGRKVLTTCQDNRIRVWDYLMAGREVSSFWCGFSHWRKGPEMPRDWLWGNPWGSPRRGTPEELVRESE